MYQSDVYTLTSFSSDHESPFARSVTPLTKDKTQEGSCGIDNYKKLLLSIMDKKKQYKSEHTENIW